MGWFKKEKSEPDQDKFECSIEGCPDTMSMGHCNDKEHTQKCCDDCKSEGRLTLLYGSVLCYPCRDFRVTFNKIKDQYPDLFEIASYVFSNRIEHSPGWFRLRRDKLVKTLNERNLIEERKKKSIMEKKMKKFFGDLK